MRRCSRCGLTRPIADFNGSTEFGSQYYCRDCQSAWYRAHRVEHVANVNANTTRYRTRNREFIATYLLTHSCVDCGEDDPAVLDFDHVNGKVLEVSRLVQFASLERLAEEISRCEIRCANCHMRRTAEQFSWRKAREVDVAEMLEVRG